MAKWDSKDERWLVEDRKVSGAVLSLPLQTVWA